VFFHSFKDRETKALCLSMTPWPPCPPCGDGSGSNLNIQLFSFLVLLAPPSKGRVCIHYTEKSLLRSDRNPTAHRFSRPLSWSVLVWPPNMTFKHF